MGYLRVKIIKIKKVRPKSNLFVPTTGVEPARPYEHYPLKVACLPIPPRGHTCSKLNGKYRNLYFNLKLIPL